MSATEAKTGEAPVQIRIEQRAYEIWIAEGCPDGCDVDHWLRAEAEISVESNIQNASLEAASKPSKAQ